jgi:hypothetical protein
MVVSQSSIQEKLSHFLVTAMSTAISKQFFKYITFQVHLTSNKTGRSHLKVFPCHKSKLYLQKKETILKGYSFISYV